MSSRSRYGHGLGQFSTHKRWSRDIAFGGCSVRNCLTVRRLRPHSRPNNRLDPYRDFSLPRRMTKPTGAGRRRPRLPFARTCPLPLCSLVDDGQLPRAIARTLNVDNVLGGRLRGGLWRSKSVRRCWNGRLVGSGVAGAAVVSVAVRPGATTLRRSVFWASLRPEKMSFSRLASSVALPVCT